MEKYWQLLFYNLYIFEKFTSNIIGWPIKKIMNIKCVRKGYKKRGVENPVELLTDSFNHLDNGMNILFATGAFSTIFFFMVFLVLNILLIVLNIHLGLNIFFIVFTAILAFVLEYFLVQVDSSHKSYFVEFDKYASKKKIFYAIITVIFIVLVITVSSITYFYTLNPDNFTN